MPLKSIFGCVLALSAISHAETRNNTISFFIDSYGADFTYARRFDRLAIEINPGLLSYAAAKSYYSDIDMFRYRASLNLAYFFPFSRGWSIAPEMGAGYFYDRENNAPGLQGSVRIFSLSPRVKLAERIGWANFEVFLGTTTAFWNHRYDYPASSGPLFPPKSNGVDNSMNLGLRFVVRLERFNLGIFLIESEPFKADYRYYNETYRYNRSGLKSAYVSNTGIFAGFNF